jgi:peptide/nickel transport system ATP-binding protein
LTTPPLLEVRELSRRFVKPLGLVGRLGRMLGGTMQAQTVRALDQVSLHIQAREVLGLVGESGCGKSTLARLICGLDRPSAGEILWRGRPLADGEADLGPAMGAGRDARAGQGIQMVFQNPMASLNPRLRVQDIVGEAPVVHGLWPPENSCA